jgi:glycosyltransferase involved in cell wall biosynthesis
MCAVRVPLSHDNLHRPIRVVINGLHAKSGGGVTYLRNIIAELVQDPRLDVHVYLHEDQVTAFSPYIEGARIHLFDFRTGFLRLLLWEQTVLPVLAWLAGAEITFSPANFGPLLAPGSVIMLRNSLAVVGREKRFSRRIYWAGLALMTGLSLLFSRRAIAVSDYARRALSFRVGAGRVAVVHHGVSSLFQPADPPGEGGYLLAVSDLYVQKNLHSLIDAMAVMVLSRPHLRLLIAGREIDRDYAAELYAQVKRLGLSDCIEFLGHVTAERLAELYRHADLFVFPSTVETFGNPLVEAMASGAAIASSNTAAMPEVLGDAGAYFKPCDVEDMAAVILSLLGDDQRRQALRVRALERAATFSWAATGAKTADVLVAAAVGHRRCGKAY